jgi:hypothetical protein
MRLADRGLALEVPHGWEARIFVPTLPAPAINLPVLHLSSGALPASRSTYAPEAGPAIGRRGTFAALIEFEPALAGVGLYAPRGLPLPIRPSDLDPSALQLPQPGQGGVQRFFSHGGRAFCLYVIAGLDVGEPLASMNRALASVEIVPASAA